MENYNTGNDNLVDVNAITIQGDTINYKTVLMKHQCIRMQRKKNNSKNWNKNVN